MDQTQAADPISYPKITLEGKEVEVKFRVGDIIRLKKAGIDIGNLGEFKGVEAFERTVCLLQAGISHSVQKSVEELSDMIDLAALPIVVQAISESLSKAAAQVTKPEPSPAQVQ